MSRRAAVDIRAGGETLTLLPPGVVWWEAAKSLIATDLHVGMSESFQAAGMGVPSGPHQRDLDDLRDVARARGAARVIVLGDVFHAPGGVTETVVAAVAAWRAALDIPVWVTPGNHDTPVRQRFGELPFDRVDDEIAEGPFLFTHLPHRSDAARSAGPFRLCGHLHPVVRLAGGKDALRLR